MSRGVLFVHSNFPAQFRDLAGALVARGTPCWAIGSATAAGLEGLPVERWSNQKGTTPGIFPLAVRAEADLIRGHAALTAAQRLKTQGADPALIVGHPGWGETVLLHEAFPKARQILFHEFFYQGRGGDIDFDQEFIPATEGMILAGTAKNAVMALALSQADAIVAPTPYQASTLPDAFRSRVRLIHEGVDTAAIRPGPAEPFALPDGARIDPATPLITHVNRHLEPMRGLHILARALPRVLAEIPEAQVVVIGEANQRGYSGAAPDGRTWKDVSLDGLDGRLDLSRVHFVGRLPHERMLAALRLSRAHVYYTYPFVLSWSLAEAMASGCYVIASDTPPVRDVIEDGVNGKLLDFFDVDALSAALIEACRRPQAFAGQRAAARETAVARFDRAAGRKAWLALIDEMGAG